MVLLIGFVLQCLFLTAVNGAAPAPGPKPAPRPAPAPAPKPAQAPAPAPAPAQAPAPAPAPAPPPPPPPPPPPFSICLTEEDAKLKFIKEPCKSDADCYDQSYDSTRCTNGVCACKEGFTEVQKSASGGKLVAVCDFLPSFMNQPCTSACKKPLVCSESAPAPPPLPPPRPPPEPMPGPRTKRLSPPPPPPPPPPGYKLCACEPPYKDKNGFCVKDCPPDQTYSAETDECVKRCGTNEMLTNKGKCKKMANLGEPCEDKRQCAVPYSDCQAGKCACAPGTKQNKGACEATKKTCPFGPPIADAKGVPVVCTIKKETAAAAGRVKRLSPPPPPPTVPLTDTCGSGQFCLVTGGTGAMVEGATGHCCGKPTPTCPVGNPHPTAVCPSYGPYDKPTPSDAIRCPDDTHICHSLTYDTVTVRVCCPAACAAQQVQAGNKCYPERDLGDQCDVNEQCRGHNGACQKGKCVCTAGKEPELHGNSGGKEWCSPVCKPGQVKIGNLECSTPSKLGEPCQPQSPNLCPQFAYCHERLKKCTCFCGYQKLDDNTCGPEPRCAGEPLPPGSGKPVFCKVPGAESASIASAVATCPKGQYCANYMQTAGLCCPKPAKAVCPDGQAAGPGCDPSQPPNACDPQGNSFCYRYMDPAGNSDPKAGSVCCQISGSGPIPAPEPRRPLEPPPPPPPPPPMPAPAPVPVGRG